MTTYRTLAFGEWDEAMRLWVGAFGDVGWIFESLNAGTEDRKLKHTLVAEQDGKIVAAVDVFMREMRDENGVSVKVGGIGSVATHPDHRRQGHSGQLLLNAIEMMREEGCAWSMLYTGLHSHYSKYGWVVTPWRKKVGVGRRPAEFTLTYEVEQVKMEGENSWPLEAMARIYSEFNARRPLSHVRTEQYWQTPIKVRLERPERRIWVASHRSLPLAYLVASVNKEAKVSSIIEVGYLPKFDNAVLDLLRVSLKESSDSVEIFLPPEPGVVRSLPQVFEQVRNEESDGPMCRPIAPDWSIERIQAMTALPQAHCWDLDGF